MLLFATVLLLNVYFAITLFFTEVLNNYSSNIEFLPTVTFLTICLAGSRSSCGATVAVGAGVAVGATVAANRSRRCCNIC